MVLLQILITTTRNLVHVTLKQTDLFNFSDHTGANRSVQIPPNALYSGAALATANNLLIIAGTQLFTFTDTGSANPFIILSTSTCLINLGFPAIQNRTSSLIPITCTLESPQIIDLRGNHSFYFTTDLITSNYNFVTLSKNGGAGSNMIEKIQLTLNNLGYTNIAWFERGLMKNRSHCCNVSFLYSSCSWCSPCFPGWSWSCHRTNTKL